MKNLTQDLITLYTDGGCIKNPGGVGAWAFFVPELNLYGRGYCSETTNNRMELNAIYNGLQAVLENGYIGKTVVITDSKYCIGVLTENNAKKNVELIDSIKKFTSSMFNQIEFQWVKGHDGDKYNEIVDSICTSVMEGKSISDIIPKK